MWHRVQTVLAAGSTVHFGLALMKLHPHQLNSHRTLLCVPQVSGMADTLRTATAPPVINPVAAKVQAANDKFLEGAQQKQQLMVK